MQKYASSEQAVYNPKVTSLEVYMRFFYFNICCPEMPNRTI